MGDTKSAARAVSGDAELDVQVREGGAAEQGDKVRGRGAEWRGQVIEWLSGRLGLGQVLVVMLLVACCSGWVLERPAGFGRVAGFGGLVATTAASPAGALWERKLDRRRTRL